MKTEDFAPFDVAKTLKEKGFDEPCDWIYSGIHGIRELYHTQNSLLKGNSVSAPTIYEIQRWLRECKNIIFLVDTVTLFSIKYGYDEEPNFNYKFYNKNCESGIYSTFEEAMIEGIKESLKYL